MGEHTAEAKPRPAHLWKPGQSGNPKGRPRTGLAFAERVRERVDPDLIIDLALRVAVDETLTPEHRLAALWPLIDRGFIKPPTATALDVNVRGSSSRDYSQVPLEERRAMLEQLRSLPHRVTDPKVIDGAAVPLALPVATVSTSTDEE